MSIKRAPTSRRGSFELGYNVSFTGVSGMGLGAGFFGSSLTMFFINGKKLVILIII